MTPHPPYVNPAFYPPEPTPEEQEKAFQKKVKRSYGNAALMLILQFLLATVVQSVITAIYTAWISVKIAAEGNLTDPEMIAEAAKDAVTPFFLLISIVISYLVANLLAFVIGRSMNKETVSCKLFGRIRMKPLDCLLSVFAVLGLQMLSLIVQNLIMTITGVSGIDETTAAVVSFSDNILHNILLVLYTVIIAAVTEELLCRGVVMNALSPISPTFGLIASSMMFGVMHGNFNQMFNGFLLGLAIGYVGIKSRSILLPILLHMTANCHAMIMSFLEYKLGEAMIAFEGVYIIVMLIVGLAAAVWLFLRNGKPNDQTDGYPCRENIVCPEGRTNKAELTWMLLVKSPAFWIFTAIYLFTAIISLTPVT